MTYLGVMHTCVKAEFFKRMRIRRFLHVRGSIHACKEVKLCYNID